MYDAPRETSARTPDSMSLIARLDAAFAGGAPERPLADEVRAMARIYDLEAEGDIAEVWAALRRLLVRQPAAAAIRPEPMTLLVAEDDPDIAADLMDTLVGAGHGVVGPFSTAEAALAAAAQHRIDAALIDINLGGAVSGVELARRLGGDWGVPSVFTSGDVPNAARNAGLAAAVVLKPYTPDQILSALGAVARHA
ncbi:response regulator [Brevundimonas balnearis]|uniref:Response regulator n=1 Tax=Brevundimonas balnearis TaxID=1572858 RepID=A0ABV6R4R4_9CAUL